MEQNVNSSGTCPARGKGEELGRSAQHRKSGLSVFEIAPAPRAESLSRRPAHAFPTLPAHMDDNDRRMAKSIEASIDFAAKRQVRQRMIP